MTSKRLMNDFKSDVPGCPKFCVECRIEYQSKKFHIHCLTSSVVSRIDGILGYRSKVS